MTGLQFLILSSSKFQVFCAHDVGSVALKRLTSDIVGNIPVVFFNKSVFCLYYTLTYY